MSQESKFFDLHISGIGYLNRTREVKPERSKPFWATDIAAIFGSADDIQRTRFDCRVVGTEAKKVVEDMKVHVDADRKVLVGFKLGDLYADTFTYASGKRAGETGVSLKARLLRIDWVKVDGDLIYTAPEPESESEPAGSAPAASDGESDEGYTEPDSGLEEQQAQADDASGDDVSDYLPEEVTLSKDDPDFMVKKDRLKSQGYRWDNESKSWKRRSQDAA